MKQTQLTKDGLNNLKKELSLLMQKKRPSTIERLQKARAMGDLSENSEYSAAKEELAFVEGRIKEIEEILKNAEVVENRANGTEISLGSQVMVEANGEKDLFTIVGEFEADPMAKKLSSTSPIGKALIGKRTHDTVEVEIPSGKIIYKVLQIR